MNNHFLLFNDATCTYKLPVLCEGVGEVTINLRGMCDLTDIDKSYMMADGEINEKRFFTGNRGWKIYWDSEKNNWRIGNPSHNTIYGLHTAATTYPLGKNYWKIVNDTKCEYPDSNRIVLNMSPCNESEFTCDEGACIPMGKR